MASKCSVKVKAWPRWKFRVDWKVPYSFSLKHCSKLFETSVTSPKLSTLQANPTALANCDQRPPPWHARKGQAEHCHISMKYFELVLRHGCKCMRWLSYSASHRTPRPFVELLPCPPRAPGVQVHWVFHFWTIWSGEYPPYEYCLILLGLGLFWISHMCAWPLRKTLQEIIPLLQE